MTRHVALVGFMASGKSTIGRKLARKLGCAFFDTDDLVVRVHGTVATIFATEGEPAFRRYEQAAIAGVLENTEPSVIALGGGALTVAANRELLAHRAHRIFLHVSPEHVLARLRRSREKRPLLGARPTLAKVKDLYDRRMAQYASADFTVEADRRSDGEVLQEIIEWLRNRQIQLGQ
ncbi:MAG TPA: shikimate kinase [Candidatus Cybelea sp.]|jgi:shikimate kinase|nr:shikimate kinase [Candidatus Cybelea sp.]